MTASFTEPRLPVFKLAPKAIEGLARANTALAGGALGKQLLELVYLRVSQINGCAFCVDMHVRDLVKQGEQWQRINSIVTWHEVGFYTERERAALQWAESLARLPETHAPQADFDALRPHFDDTEIAELTVAVAVINAWNRIAVGLRLPVVAAPL